MGWTLSTDVSEVRQLSETLAQIGEIAEKNDVSNKSDHKKYELAKDYAPQEEFVAEMEANAKVLTELKYFKKASYIFSKKEEVYNDCDELALAAKFSTLTDLCKETTTLVKRATTTSTKYNAKIDETIEDYYLTKIYKYSGKNFKTTDDFRDEAPKLYKKRDRAKAIAEMPDGVLYAILGLCALLGFGIFMLCLVFEVFPGGFGEFLNTAPIGSIVGIAMFAIPLCAVAFIGVVSLQSKAKDKLIERNRAIEARVAKAQQKEKKIFDGKFGAWLGEKGVDITISCAATLKKCKADLVELLGTAMMLSNGIVEKYLMAVPKKYINKTEALEKMRSFLLDGEAESVKEAASLYVEFVKERKAEEKRRTEIVEALKGLGEVLEKQFEATRAYAEATVKLQEARIGNSRKEESKAYKIDTDWNGREVIVDEDGNQITRVDYVYSDGNVQGVDGKIYHRKSK